MFCYVEEIWYMLQSCTLLFKLSDNIQYIYIEIVSTLICCFLSSVRMAEHTVTSTVVEKFITTMDEMRDVLAKFGTSLLNREHVRCSHLVLFSV